jgi:hypothetical protein
MARTHARRRLALVAFAVIAVLATAVPAASARQASTNTDCITYRGIPDAPRGKISRDDAVTVHRDKLAKWPENHPWQARQAASSTGTITIPVAFHVIRKDTSVAGGNAPLSWIEDQIDVLNAAYSGATGGVDTGFRFRLASVDRTTEVSWFKFFYTQGGEPRFFRGSHKEIRIKRALHEGDAGTLNVYTGALGKLLLGWAYFPTSFTGEDALPRFYDGVAIDYRTMPGATFGPYDEGDTLVHEVGHWLEVYHTFQGGCVPPGDHVADTPFEASPAFGCPEDRDTCEAKPGEDPITNFMDYTDDACMFEFTADQAERMHMAWAAYRA